MDDNQRTDPREVDLTAEESEGIARLPLEKVPSDLLEARVVDALLREELLHTAPRRSPRRPIRWVAAAAGVALFLSGVAVGQLVGYSTTANNVLAVRDQEAAMAAAAVQEAGTAYVAALAALTRLESEDADAQRRQGREAALGAIFAAADILARVEPDNPTVVRVLQALEDTRSKEVGEVLPPESVISY